MSSYQSQEQTQSTEQTTDVQESTNEQSTGPGNQAEVEQAGLEGGGSDDYSLTGPFANLLLDVMPLGAALKAAIEVITNPVVQDWIRALPDQALIEALSDDRSLVDFILQDVLPVGAGVEVSEAVGGTLVLGVELGATGSISRPTPDQLHFEAHPILKIAAAVGEGGKVLDAFGNGVNLSAEAEASYTAKVDLTSTVPLSLPALLQYAGASAADVLIPFWLSTPAAYLTGVDELANLSATVDGVTEDNDASLAVGGKAEATAQFDGIDAVPAPIAGPIGMLADPLMLDASGLAQATGLVEGSLSIGDDGLGTVAFKGTVGALAEAKASMEAVLMGTELAALDAVASVSGSAEVSAEFEFDIQKMRTEGKTAERTTISIGVTTSAGADLSTEGEADHAAVTTSTMTFDSFGAAAAVICNDVNELDGNGNEAIPGTEASKTLAEVLVDVGSVPSVTETIELELDAQRLAAELPAFAGMVGIDDLAGETNVGVISSDSELKLSGAVPVTPADFQTAADTGIVLPGTVARGKALDDVAEAISAARGGGSTPGWLSEWEQGLRSAFAGQSAMNTAQLKGFVGVGAGGELAAEEVAKAEGKVQGTVKYTIDRAATAQDIEMLLAAM